MVLVSIRQFFLKRGSGVVGSLSEAMEYRERTLLPIQYLLAPSYRKRIIRLEVYNKLYSLNTVLHGLSR